jgi:hypothetical protein
MRKVITTGIDIHTPDGGPWARDAAGRSYDRLTEEEAASIMPPSAIEKDIWEKLSEANATIAELRAQLEKASKRHRDA